MAPRQPASTAPHPDTIRVVLVESSALVGLGIRGVLDGEPDMEVVGEVRSAGDALAMAEDRAPDVFLVDVELQEPATSAATRKLTQEAPGSGIVVVGREDDDASILEAIDVGARGHVASIVKPAELVAVIRQVADGEDPLKDEVIGRPDLVDKIMEGFRESFRRDAPPNPLTPRELDVVTLVAKGLRNRQIAESLDIGEQTVKNHLQSVMHKLGVSSRVRAVTLAIREGWLTLDEVDETSPAIEAPTERV
jgi:DNA-binding NarL/FixJ family response regulator